LGNECARFRAVSSRWWRQPRTHGQPKILLLDEPSGGLSPQFVNEIANTMKVLKDAGTTMLIVEQNLGLAFKVADRFIILRDGVVIDGGAVGGLKGSHEDIVRSIYL
jgi:branched-chain amino acid transport system ATP-binding protein